MGNPILENPSLLIIHIIKYELLTYIIHGFAVKVAESHIVTTF